MTQAHRIIRHLARGGTLTRLDAWDKLGILEAPARISELRAQGWQIRTEKVQIRNRYGEAATIARWRYQDTPGNERRLLELEREQVARRLRDLPVGSGAHAACRARLTIIDDSLRQLAAMLEGMSREDAA